MTKKKARAWINPDFKKDLKMTAIEHNKTLLDLKMEDLIGFKKKKKDPFRFKL